MTDRKYFLSIINFDVGGSPVNIGKGRNAAEWDSCKFNSKIKGAVATKPIVLSLPIS